MLIPILARKFFSLFFAALYCLKSFIYFSISSFIVKTNIIKKVGEKAAMMNTMSNENKATSSSVFGGKNGILLTTKNMKNINKEM
ncbi:MAG: hypothetical protein IKK68_02120 [Paludibacteraceae bacterium]|jgi:hypothetical protein|nr:hypothetical protein [Paludibacteraceae bacterium]